LAAVLVAGCNKSSTAASAPRADAAARQVVIAASQPAAPGVIRGRVLFSDPKPVMQSVDVKGLAACTSGHAAPMEEYAIVNSNGTLKNVVVYVQGIPPANGANRPSAVLDQVHCQYVPHVVALQIGQKLIVRSSDDTMHNIHGQPRINPAFNFAQIRVGVENVVSFKAAEIFPVQCDVHPWMNATIAVFDSSCFAVTGDDGSFEIRSVPPGEYTLIAWHEHYDKLEQQVKVGADRPAQVDFTYSPPP
jgi:hypothetical protein